MNQSLKTPATTTYTLLVHPKKLKTTNKNTSAQNAKSPKAVSATIPEN
jgi:hypothetical protein